MIERILKRNYIRIVDEYGDKLASDSTSDPSDVEMCHLAKLVLLKESEIEARAISLRTLSDVRMEAAIPHILRELVLLTKGRPDNRTAQLIVNLYAILCPSR